MTILIVGEYPSQRDLDEGGLFRDGNGKMLRALLRQVGINPRHAHWDSVLRDYPNGGFRTVVGPKATAIPNMKPIGTKYVRAEFEPQIREFWDRVNRIQPTVIIALGDLAVWATTSESKIKEARGRITPAHSGLPGLKVVPSWAPRTVAADYPLKISLLYDLAKAERESHFREFRRPQRFIHVEPTLAEMEDFYHEFIVPCTHLSVDIELKGYKEGLHSITCVGFAPSKDRCLVVPFFTENQPDGNYWRTVGEELKAWAFVRRMCKLGKAVGGQNFQFDTQHLLRGMGIAVPDFQWDTMLQHHSLQPELDKGLGFLASLHTDEPAWKGMHKTTAAKGQKRGDD